jgi:predicted nucleic acid-binding protein
LTFLLVENSHLGGGNAQLRGEGAASFGAVEILRRAFPFDQNLALGLLPGFEDIAIAATGVAHGLTVATANERHFAPLGIPYVNPLKGLP